LKNIYIITLLLAALFISCYSAKRVCKKVTSNAYITLEQTACYGKCPIYTFTLDGSGAAFLDARRFMDNLGTFEAKINLDTLCVTFAGAKDCKWETYEEEYLSGYSDMPSTILRYSPNQKDIFTVKFEGEMAPVELLLITEKLKSIKEDAKWILTSEPILN
jgi:hypothetical protein